MESPVRKLQKRNDYNRHKLFRKIKRRRKAELEQLSKAAEKELKRRLRWTAPKLTGGKTTKHVYAPGSQIYESVDPVTGDINYSINDVLGNEVPVYIEDNTAENKRDWTFRDADGTLFGKHKQLSTYWDVYAHDKPLELVSPEFDIISGLKGFNLNPVNLLKKNNNSDIPITEELFNIPWKRGVESKIIIDPNNSSSVLKLGKTRVQDAIDLQIINLNIINKYSYIHPSTYKQSINGLFGLRPVWLQNMLNTTYSRERFFNPITGKMINPEEGLILEAEGKRTLDEIYDSARLLGHSIDDNGNIITPDGIIYDFGYNHNIGRTNDGKAVIFDAKFKPSIVTNRSSKKRYIQPKIHNAEIKLNDDLMLSDSYKSVKRFRGSTRASDNPISDILRLLLPSFKTGDIGYGHKYRIIGNNKGLEDAIKYGFRGKHPEYVKNGHTYWSQNEPFREYNGAIMASYDKNGPYVFKKGNFENPISGTGDIKINDDNIRLYGRYPFTSTWKEYPKTQKGFDLLKKLGILNKYVETPVKYGTRGYLGYELYDYIFNRNE